MTMVEAEEVKAKVERLDWRTFMSASPETPESTTKALDDYFSKFVAVAIGNEGGKPVFKSQDCCNCGETLTGFSGLFGRGGFEWGIAHGYGHCAGCKWPCVGHHFIKDEAGEDVLTLRNFILQVHPDFVERRSRS
jgi:hypothetical protein